MKLSNDLREFVELLNAQGVEYVIVGGHAVAFHGHPRFTGDIDFFIRAESNNARRLLAVLQQFGFGSLGLTESTFTHPDQVVQLGRPPNRIDIMTSISGVDFETAWSGRVSGTMDGLTVTLLGRVALIQNKKASGRLKDLADVEALTEE